MVEEAVHLQQLVGPSDLTLFSDPLLELFHDARSFPVSRYSSPEEPGGMVWLYYTQSGGGLQEGGGIKTGGKRAAGFGVVRLGFS